MTTYEVVLIPRDTSKPLAPERMVGFFSASGAANHACDRFYRDTAWTDPDSMFPLVAQVLDVESEESVELVVEIEWEPEFVAVKKSSGES